MTALVSHSQRLMIPQRRAASLDKEVSHINLTLIWPSYDHVPSDVPEAAPEGRGMWARARLFSHPRQRCHLLGEAQHICSCWPPTSTPLPFLSTAGRKMISCDAEHNKRRTGLFLLLYPLLWLVSTPAVDKPIIARTEAAVTSIDYASV